MGDFFAMGEGRSLLHDPLFLELVRQYAQHYEPPRRADLADVLHGTWCAVRVVPGRERKIVDRLADNLRLALYVPMVRKALIVRGRLRQFQRALFSGYIFTKVVGLETYWQRIRECDGVLGILIEAGEPAIITEAEIERMRVIEAQQDGLVMAWPEEQARRSKKKNRRRLGKPPQIEICPPTGPGP